MTDPAAFTSAQFLFNTPLYTPLKVSRFQLTDLVGSGERHGVDGFCPFCGQASLFHNTGHAQGDFRADTDEGVKKLHRIIDIEAICRRDAAHMLRFQIELKNLTVQKIGQLPSFVDLVDNPRALYRRELTRVDAAEFRRAIELAAHGMGIGAYVYLRRIFERLVQIKFEKVKDAAGWDAQDFAKSRMDDKVLLLGEHLPLFLVQNYRLYSILSVGIHQLDEASCSAFFPILKDSILYILRQDQAAREDEEARKALAKEISGFKPALS
jgi:hypothetical protein